MTREQLVDVLARAEDRTLDLCRVDLQRSDLRNLDLANVDLRHAKLTQADLTGSRLERVQLAQADLTQANLNNATLIEVDLSESSLDRASFHQAHLYRVNLTQALVTEADLSKVRIFESHMRAARLTGSTLDHSSVTGTDLRDSDLSFASLIWAYLGDVDLAGASFSYANVADAVLAPREMSPALAVGLETARNLFRLRLRANRATLVRLREEFRVMGLKDQQRELNYAIRSDEAHPILRRSFLEVFHRAFEYIGFDLTCGYGLFPGRALLLLVALIPGFALFYTVPLICPIGNGRLWKVWSPTRIVREVGSEEPLLLVATGVAGGRVARWIRVLWISFYFSILSAASIGWRDINLGHWITRLQRDEYLLHGTGWVRSVAGLQSLISVFLLALWAITYFVGPLE